MNGVRPGAAFGPYRLLFELAAGGLGKVHVALHRGAGDFERLVVIKEPHAHLLSNKEFHAMFRDEARLAASIRHPNVVPVTDVLETEQTLLMVMEYVESVSLATLVKRAGELPPAIVSRIMIDALHGLHASHEAKNVRGEGLGIVHRDVSPQNLLTGADGITRVIDFGIARASSRLTETEPGSVKGKLAYMSPEQVDGMTVDRRSDVFSAAVVLFESMTGTRLFDGASDGAIIRKLLLEPMPAARSRRAELPENLDEVLSIALQRNPELRFATAEAFAAALENGVTPARPADVAELVRRTCGRDLSERAAQVVKALGVTHERLVSSLQFGNVEEHLVSTVRSDNLSDSLPLEPALAEVGPTRVSTSTDGSRASSPSRTLPMHAPSGPPVLGGAGLVPLQETQSQAAAYVTGSNLSVPMGRFPGWLPALIGGLAVLSAVVVIGVRARTETAAAPGEGPGPAIATTIPVASAGATATASSPSATASASASSSASVAGSTPPATSAKRPVTTGSARPRVPVDLRDNPYGQ